MNNLNNILLYEQNPEALEAVRLGEAKISTGGIRRPDGTYLDLAKPACMSVAELLSLVEDKEHSLAVDEQLRQLDTRLNLSVEGMKQLQEIGWLNNVVSQQTYTVTYEGFKRTLLGLECVTNHVRELGQYIRERDIKDNFEKAQLYMNYMKTDAGKMKSNKFIALQNNVDEHIDQMAAFINRLTGDVLEGTGDPFISLQILGNLLSPFSCIVRRFSALYYYENENQPGNYGGWIGTISSIAKSKNFRNKLGYYINLKTTLPYRDKMLASREVAGGVRCLLSGMEFDKRYMLTHSKEDYFSLPEQIQKKVGTHDYVTGDGHIGIFL